MADHSDEEPIQLSGDRLVEIRFQMINLTGIPDEQFRSVDEEGNPIVETETMDYPLIDFDDLPMSTNGGPADEGPPVGARIPRPGANGSTAPGAPSSVPPKSV